MKRKKALIGLKPIRKEVHIIKFKKCSCCKKWLPLEYFAEKSHRCRICNRDNDWKRRYGLEADTFFSMLKNQDNKCLICEKEFTSMPHVDHNHDTGAIRGLLCADCNRGLGRYEKDRMNGKIIHYEEYLKRFKK